MSSIIEKIMQPGSLRVIVISKVLFITVFLLLEGGFIYFGERNLTAQEGGANAVATSPAVKETGDEKEETTNSKSYLERLLDMPVVDEKDLKKSEVARYLDIIQRKKSQVELRITTLAERERALQKLEQTIEEKITHLEEERRFFAESIQKEKEVKKERLDDLISFYQKMGAKKAAPVFEKMDKDLVVQLFKNMPVKQTMGILELMNPERSVELTEYYGRIKSGKEYDLLKEVNKSLVDEFKENCSEKEPARVSANTH